MSGRTQVHLISDGTIKLDGGVMFGQIPKRQWQEWVPADRRNRIRLGMNCLLATVDNQHFLIDTGCGPKQSPDRRDTYGLAISQLLSSLKRFELSPQDIYGVVLTSLHFEHAGGCTRIDRKGEVIPTFPKAQYFVQRQAFEEARAPSERDTEGHLPDDFLPLYHRGQLELLDGDAILAPGLQVRPTNGPTVGHQIVLVTHGGERLAFLGDLVPTPYHLQLPCIAASDLLPEETLRNKRDVLNDAVKEGWLLVFSHGMEDRAGYLERRNDRPYLRSINLD